MADVYLRRPDGQIVAVAQEDAQAAADAGYTALPEGEARAAQAEDIRGLGEDAAVTQGRLVAPEGYDTRRAAIDKAVSGLTFGGRLFGEDNPLATPKARATGLRFAEEHPYASFGAELAGQLPYAVAGGVAGAAVRGVAGGGLGLAADVGANAIIGGAQTEAEVARLEGRDFSWTDAAITGVAGEVLGRNAAWAISRGVGGSRNLITRAERQTIAADADASLRKGGWVRDYQTAQHAEAYRDQLADLAARDLDTLETSFDEVSRQDRKRARIGRIIKGDERAQAELRTESIQELMTLRDALRGELEAAPSGPARALSRHLDSRIAELEVMPPGRKLWTTLDENRQALQEYRQDLHQAYSDNPGSAWLSREGLAAIDAAEEGTRNRLLREDAWGPRAVEAQRAYNTPFHEKWFPARKTVAADLHFVESTDARGFPVFRGEPGRVRKFLAGLGEDGVDTRRIREQFTQYLDGAEAIARAGAGDAPRAARDALEAIRRLRKAMANAELVNAAAARTARRGAVVDAGAKAAGAVGGLAVAGPVGAGAAVMAMRGARIGDWLGRAGAKLGWFKGEPIDFAAVLGRDALPPAATADIGDELLDDIADAPLRGGPDGSGAPPAPSSPHPDPAGRPTPVDTFEGEPSMMSASELPDASALADDLHAGLADTQRAPVTAEAAAFTHETMGGIAGAEARRAEARRIEALTQGEFRDVVKRLKAVDARTPDGESIADALERSESQLIDDGWVNPRGTMDLRDVPPASEFDLSDFDKGPTFAEQDAAQAAAEAPHRDPAIRAGTNAIEAGIEVDDVEWVGDGLTRIFGGKPPTAADWARIAPVEILQQLGPVETSQLSRVGDDVYWNAHGPELPNGMRAWRIARTYLHGPDGPEVYHDYFFIDDSLQGTGVGAEALKSMMEGYRRLGVAEVSVSAADVGRYFWPSIGFDNPSAVPAARQAYERWLVTRKGLSMEEAKKATKNIRSLPSLAQAEFGKDFLLDSHGAWNMHLSLRLDDANPLYHLMRGRLGIELAAIAALGGAGVLEAGNPDQAAQDDARAGVAPALAAFGGRVVLFKQLRAKLVSDVARKMFTQAGHAAARTTARLAYTHATIDRRNAEFAEWQQNPQELVDRVAEGFRDVPPEHTGEVNAGVFRTAAFLKTKLPSVTKINAVSMRTIPVSTDAARRYAAYEHAALNPREAVQAAAEAGHMSTELLETLAELYPDLLAELRVAAYVAVREDGPPPTIQQRVAYARLFEGDGRLADPSMSPTVARMAAYSFEASVPSDKPAPTGGTPGISRMGLTVAMPGPIGRV